MKAHLRFFTLLLAVIAGSGSLAVMAQTPALEFAGVSGAAATNGPSGTTGPAITFQNNTDNPTGTTFVAYGPATTVSFALTNQQYTLSAAQSPTGVAVNLGCTPNLVTTGPLLVGFPYYPLMNNLIPHADVAYTSVPGTTGGIASATNRGASVFASIEGLPFNAPKTVRYQFADLTITFSRAVVNPVLHIDDLGGRGSSTLAFSTEMELLNPGTSTLSKLSGETQFLVDAVPTVGTPQIRNGNSNPAVANGFVSGSVLVSTAAAGVTSLTFRLYMRGDAANASNWHTNPNTTDNSGDLFYVGVSTLTPVADVATTIAANPSPVVAGQPLSFAVNYTNAGPSAANSYTQTLQLTAGLGAANVTFSNLPTGVTAAYNDGTGVVTFTGTPTTLASGANQNLTVNILAVPFSFSSVTASTTVGTIEYQGADTGPNSATNTVSVTPVADVATIITASPGAAVAGQPLSFAVIYTNAGPNAAPNYTQTLQLSAGLGAANVTFSNLPTGVTAAYNSATGAVTFTGTPTTLANGANQNLTVNILTVPAGLASITASTTVGTTANQGADTGANSATSTVPVATPTDLLTTLSGPISATQGNEVTLNVTTTNNGPATGYNVVQTVQLVAGLSNVFVSNNGTYNSGSGLVTFPTLSSLSSGQTATNYVSFKAPATAFTPTATVTPNTIATGDTNPANNTAALNGVSGGAIAINAASANVANLYNTIASSAQTVPAGANVTLTVVTGNAGPATAYNVSETVQLQPGLSGLLINGVAATGPAVGNEVPYANGNKYNTQTGIVTFAPLTSLASAGTATNTLTFAAPATTSGQLLASAAVSSTSATAAQVTTDPVPADNLASTKIMITQNNADLVAAITGPATVAAGQPITYTATFTNNGAGAADQAVATVQLPAGLSSVTLSQGTYNATTGLVTFPTVASAAPGTALSYTVSYTPTANGTYKASAGYTSSTPDGTPANNTASTSTSVTPVADVTVVLNATDIISIYNGTTTGGVVTYASQTTNNGPSAAAATTTVITLPASALGVQTPVFDAGGVYDATARTVTFSDGTLASGATVSHYVTFQNRITVTGTAFATTAAVTTTTAEANTANNTASKTLTTSNAITTTEVLSTTLTGPATLNPGASGTYAATYTSGSVSSNLAEVMYLPPGTQVTSVNGLTTGYTYDSTTGILTFGGTTLASGTSVTYNVIVVAPSTGPFRVISAITSLNREALTSDNIASLNTTITPSTAYDEQTVLTGPASALPGAAATYTVQTLNNGPANSGTVVQSVSFPFGTVVTNNGGGTVTSTATTTTITFPAITNQAPGTGGDVTNTFTVTMPASGSLVVNASVTATGETGTAANNTASTTTTQGNQAPVAASTINALMIPRGNTAGPQLISPLTATDADGTIASYQLTSIPNAATQGTLYYDNGGTYTAITSAIQPLTAAQAQTLKFAPVSTFVGNVFFAYTAIDNLGGISTPALYTIQVGQDNAALYGTTPVKGGTAANGLTKYAVNDVIAFVSDVNAARYNSTGQLYDATTGALAAGAANGLATTGTNATTDAAGTTLLAAQGLVLNPSTGQITVSDPTKLTAGTYTVNITTTDLFGGVTTQPVTFTIGAKPLPVELTAFVATAKNQDALLTWSTASEKNNDHFNVERSLNGTDYVKIGQVKGQGTTSAPTDYALTDAGIGAKASGLVYYRLKQFDADGTSSYSPVRTVRFGKVVPAIALFPNPATTATRLDLTALPAGSYQVSVLDATGRVVLATTLEAGLTHALQLNTIASGSYLLLVRGANGGQVVNLTKRLIKE